MFKIDKNVPIPENPRKPTAEKYPFGFMDPDDSFFVPNPGIPQEALRSRVYAAATYFRRKAQKYNDWKFLVITESTNQGGKQIYGVRCWRTR